MQLYKLFLEFKHSSVLTASVIEMRWKKDENDQSLIQTHWNKRKKKKKEKRATQTQCNSKKQNDLTRSYNKKLLVIYSVFLNV